MKNEDFTTTLVDIVQDFIDNFDRYDSDPQLRVNPQEKRAMVINGRDLYDEVEDSDEAVENAAAAEGAENEEAMDFQARENPDFYPMRTLLTTDKKGRTVPNIIRIEAIAEKYS